MCSRMNDKLWEHRESDTCPWSGEKETAVHVLVCHEELAVQTFWDSVEKLNEWMVQEKTLTEAIKQALMLWKLGRLHSPESLSWMCFAEVFYT